ncbi:MAG: hypothetical protein AAB682_02600 [Patescibacteria group bacterium]
MNPKEEGKGPLIGSIIVILVLVLGAVYILANKKTVEQPVAEQPAETVDATATGPSDEVADIEAELNANDEASLDASIDTLGKEVIVQ